ncbi:protein-L-isoaspartate O-methyltransferase family protein [Georgenia sp. H159]|uniref:protein-L-isoaspartate O-methyltransferase family protein n=1 Tax=Georgenia sp. H159 TaxID=3076115 RepID=UPI002D79A584|nr:methyltransferase domain-containing protein [Georgenia sp. H159]
MERDASARVRRAMDDVDRRGFLPEDQERFADADQPLSIGHGATCSQPTTVREMLTLLEVDPGQRVLDIGAGSGWTTALLASLAGPDGEVVGVELEPALVEFGRTNVATWAPGRDCAPARIELARPGELGLPDAAPFDRILVSAESKRLPEELVAQLADGGRMVIPVRGALVVADRAGSAVTTRAVGSFRFVPLREPSAEA